MPCPQLISELDITGGDERKVGYYAGMIVRRSLLSDENVLTVEDVCRRHQHTGYPEDEGLSGRGNRRKGIPEMESQSELPKNH